MDSMRFHGPSPNDEFFRTPPDQRPLVDLAITQRSDLLPPRLRQSNSGANRLFDLVMGFGLDEALRHETPASEVHAALDAGDLLIHAYFTEQAEYNKPGPGSRNHYGNALYIGAIEAFGNVLVVAAGRPERPKTSMQYTKTAEGYVPTSGIAVRETRSPMLAIEPLEFPKPYRPSHFPRGSRTIPKELKAAHYLGQMTDEIITGLRNEIIVSHAKVGL